MRERARRDQCGIKLAIGDTPGLILRAQGRGMPEGTLYVGDVHGCAQELAELLRRADPAQVVLVGDLFTKGPDPVGVWEIIRERRARAVLGNHDDFVVRNWKHGDTPAIKALRKKAPKARGWLSRLPLFIEEHGRVVVHAGVHPTLGIAGTLRNQAIRMRRWPDDTDAKNPHWYDAGWVGPELVVFGHDAVRGLVRREVEGRTVALGLDTGCVYGGALTGWLAEADQLFSVAAYQTWQQPGGARQ